MHEYDTAFKLLLQSVDLAMRELAGTPIVKWLTAELPEVRNTRVDMLGETDAGDLVHIELQSTNDPKMCLRMAEYCLRVYRLFGRFPHQVLLYVGEAPVAMAAELVGPTLRYSYRLVDIRELDGERLLNSPRVEDNILAVLAGVADVRLAVHRVVERIAGLESGDREAAFAKLMILAGLRRIGKIVEDEAKRMPILNSILDHEVLGREYKKGLEQGEFNVLSRLIESRFGELPTWAEQRLRSLSSPELEELAVKVLNANSLEQLFR